MTELEFATVVAWIAEAGLAGKSETAIVTGFCNRLVALGIPLARAAVIIDTLHPIYEGRAFVWQGPDKEMTILEYGRTDTGEPAERWHRSPLYHLVQSGEAHMRRRLSERTDTEFDFLAEIRAAGMTDYLALINRFAADGIIGDMDCVYSYWIAGGPNGFADADIVDMKRVAPLLALAVKSASLARIAKTLVETYLGRGASERVLNGRIAPGIADRIEAVLWFSDLRGYTRITDRAPPEHIIPLLNDYTEVIVSAIHDQGGDVLKLMGDGTLAIFTAENRSDACQAALRAMGGAPWRRRIEPTSFGPRSAGYRNVSWPAYRRGVLRQRGQQTSAGFHGGRAGRQRSQPNRGVVPFRRSASAGLRGVFDSRGRSGRLPCVGGPFRPAWRRPGAGPLYARPRPRDALLTMPGG
jgi:adenylate cyclase